MRPFSTSTAQTLPRSISCITPATRGATRCTPNQLCSRFTSSRAGFSALAGLHCAAGEQAVGGAGQHWHAAVPHHHGSATAARQYTPCLARAGLLAAIRDLESRNRSEGGSTLCCKPRVRQPLLEVMAGEDSGPHCVGAQGTCHVLAPIAPQAGGTSRPQALPMVSKAPMAGSMPGVSQESPGERCSSTSKPQSKTVGLLQ